MTSSADGAQLSHRMSGNNLVRRLAQRDGVYVHLAKDSRRHAMGHCRDGDDVRAMQWSMPTTLVGQCTHDLLPGRRRPVNAGLETPRREDFAFDAAKDLTRARSLSLGRHPAVS